MDEYIDREVVLNAKEEIVTRMQEFRDEWKSFSENAIDYHNGRNDGMEVGQRIVKAILTDILDNPAADVVEVVRCEKCKRCELRYPTKAIGEEAIEGYWCHSNQKYVTPSDFCSYGERKGGVQE